MILAHEISKTKTPYVDWGGTDEWKKTPDSEINCLFEQFLTGSEFGRHARTSLGYNNQFNRLLGFDFGEVEETFKGTVVKIANGTGNESLSMALAVRTEKVGEEELKYFNIYFKTFDGDTVKFWKPGQSKEDHGMDYNPIPHELGVSDKKHGISTELRNQLCYNWGAIPFSLVSDMFYAQASPKNPESPIPNGLFHLSKGWVRAHEYQITKNNLNAFKVLMHESPKVEIKTKFGINLSDALLGTDIFTIVIEIKNVNTNETSYLEFVHACPPFCDP